MRLTDLKNGACLLLIAGALACQKKASDAGSDELGITRTSDPSRAYMATFTLDPRDRSSHICNGVVIDQDTILTSISCVTKNYLPEAVKLPKLEPRQNSHFYGPATKPLYAHMGSPNWDMLKVKSFMIIHDANGRGVAAMRLEDEAYGYGYKPLDFFAPGLGHTLPAKLMYLAFQGPKPTLRDLQIRVEKNEARSLTLKAQAWEGFCNFEEGSPVVLRNKGTPDVLVGVLTTIDVDPIVDGPNPKDCRPRVGTFDKVSEYIPRINANRKQLQNTVGFGSVIFSGVEEPIP